MDSMFGNVFLFLTDLAWKSRLTIPMLVTTAFLVMDIRLQIEINIQTGQVNASDLDEDGFEEHFIGHGLHALDNESDGLTDDLDYNSEYTIGDENSNESNRSYSADIFEDFASEFDTDIDIDPYCVTVAHI